MSKQILIIKGSPRPAGNSSTLADQAAAGAREAGAQVESILLAGLDIRPCDGCDACRENGACILEDSMQALYPKIQAANAIILASPIYWFTYSAQLKAFIDRWYALWNGSKYDAFQHTAFGVILAYGDDDLYTSGGINAIHTFETMFRFLRVPHVEWVYGTLNNIGDAQKNPALMQKAFQMGKKLAELA